MKSKLPFWFGLAAGLLAPLVQAQMIRPPAFMGGIPGMGQFQAIQMQRAQARALLYREALEELRKNPAAADVRECAAGQVPKAGECLARPEPVAAMAATPALVAAPLPPVVSPPPASVAAAGKPAPVIEAPAAAVPIATPPALAAPVARRFAILVGNNAYAAPIPALDTPIADVSQIASVLQTRFGFETKIVKDAGKAKLIESLNSIAAEAKPEDAVLLMYAGHGYLMEDIKMGYWIPVDASVKTAQGWISNSDISKLLLAIRARQLILISDSCYSGSLTKEQKVVQGKEIKAEEILKQRSVLVFSSGADEPVSDEGKDGHSIFAWNLIKTLQSTGSLTAGAQIWSVVSKGVTREYPQQPQYGAVVSAGHTEGGDFLFQTPK
ncbi:MAG: caspase family protein [Rhodocyclales bacterium]|nr:caspase family protein [Rhodocyclales bacterium]